nr:PREDICTED: uncharacterized protein LOC105678080 [Linepithema humile]
MRRYHNYLEKKFLKVPRTSQYRRNIECESSDESSDNSVEDAQWREYCNRQSSSDSDNTDSDNTSQHNSICLSFSNEALLANIRNNEQLTISSDLSLHLVQDQHMELVQHNYHESLSTHEDPFIEQNNDQQSLSALEQVSVQYFILKVRSTWRSQRLWNHFIFVFHRKLKKDR